MGDEQLYKFVDKSGHCFEDFQKREASESGKKYYNMIGAMLRVSNDGDHDFSVGDMLCFRDELQEAGYEWGKDFYVVKV